MKTIGLIGGVASGKSLVAKYLAELGAGILDADRAGHELLASDPGVHAALRERWGNSVFPTPDSVNRTAIAARVFGDSAESIENRKFLEDLLHPRIRARLETERRQLEAAHCPAVVLDAPLLLEAGWQSLCDFILFVDTSRETRFSRAQARGWSETEFARREAAQWPVDGKRRHADIVLANSGSVDDLSAAVDSFWRKNIAPADGAPNS